MTCPVRYASENLREGLPGSISVKLGWYLLYQSSCIVSTFSACVAILHLSSCEKALLEELHNCLVLLVSGRGGDPNGFYASWCLQS